ncbi:MAG: hypothetical protein K0Q50_625 [Vampirovibrio sp.]|jgi:hypothetical protein|nr:hypothetical protein [Vampirovibrio sp.]
MDLSLYRILTQQLSPAPDLSLVKQGQLLPEEWPVVLDKIQSYRKKVLSFTITDGKTSVLCMSDVPDLYDRIASTEVGTIIHLLGARTVFSQSHRTYILQIEDFVTLKQYDDHLRAIREAEARRLADLHDELAEYHKSYQD